MQTRAELKRLQQELGTTTLYVTHDQGEAMTMGARVAVLRAGVIEQVGLLDLYREPANKFVATFVGSPAYYSAGPEGRRRDGSPGGGRAGVAGGGHGMDRSPGAGGRADGERDHRDPGTPACRRVVARAAADLDLAAGAPAWFSLAPGRSLLFDAATGRRVA